MTSTRTALTTSQIWTGLALCIVFLPLGIVYFICAGRTTTPVGANGARFDYSDDNTLRSAPGSEYWTERWDAVSLTWMPIN